MIFVLLIMTSYGCWDSLWEGKQECHKNVGFDLINGTSEYCHIYFKGDDMSSNNLVGPNTYITRYSTIFWTCSDEGYDDAEVEVTICVGKDQKKILCKTKVFATELVDVKWNARWDGSNLEIAPAK